MWLKEYFFTNNVGKAGKAKLDKAAASLLAALPIIKNETCSNNLPFFSDHVAFPFLNCIENCNQKNLLDILSTFYRDLINDSTPYQNIN